MGFFDILSGASSSIGQFTGAMGTNFIVPPLEVDDMGLIGDGFDWLKTIDPTGLGSMVANVARNSYLPTALRRSVSGLPTGSERPVNNIATRYNVANPSAPDWRVRLIVPQTNPIWDRLSSGVLAPLKDSNGLIFPYTPQIDTSYVATYEDMHPTHSNYSTPAFNKSKAETITIVADFSSNSTDEAAFSLAAIHFFRTVTKMFFGNDGDHNGRPPPILVLRGMGAYMFNNVPVVCKSAAFSFSKDVDYVPVSKTPSKEYRTNVRGTLGTLGERIDDRINTVVNPIVNSFNGLFNRLNGNGDLQDITYVPAHFQVNVQLQPIYSRTEIAKSFSLQKFATGDLTKEAGII